MTLGIMNSEAFVCTAASHFAPIEGDRSANVKNSVRLRRPEFFTLRDRLLSGGRQSIAHLNAQKFNHFMTVFQSIV